MDSFARTDSGWQIGNHFKSSCEEERMKKVLLLLTALCVLGSPAMAEDVVKIGLMGPMTGSWASEGQEMKQVVELLAEDLNAKGGVMGKKVEVITEDDAGDPRTAALASQRLITQGVVAVVGTYGSSVTEATQNIYDEAGIIQIANGSTAIRLTAKGLKYFFRTCPRDDEQGKVGAQTIKDMGFKKVAILHDNTTYAKGLADETKALLEKMEGVEIVFFEALTPGEQDYNAILTKMKGSEPDVVFFTGYYGEAGLDTQSTDTETLAAYLKNDLKGFPGLTGEISFSPSGDRVGEAYRVYKVDEEGNFILQ